jgi:hypothetical protein
MLTRKRKKLTKTQALRVLGRKYLECSACNVEEIEVSDDISSVICSTCVQKLVGAPPAPKPKSDKPRGWHLKPFFEMNGVVYTKGVEVTDADDIKNLRKQYTTPVKVSKSVPTKKVGKKSVQKKALRKPAQPRKKLVAKKKGVKHARTTR